MTDATIIAAVLMNIAFCGASGPGPTGVTWWRASEDGACHQRDREKLYVRTCDANQTLSNDGGSCVPLLSLR